MRFNQSQSSTYMYIYCVYTIICIFIYVCIYTYYCANAYSGTDAHTPNIFFLIFILTLNKWGRCLETQVSGKAQVYRDRWEWKGEWAEVTRVPWIYLGQHTFVKPRTDFRQTYSTSDTQRELHRHTEAVEKVSGFITVVKIINWARNQIKQD